MDLDTNNNIYIGNFENGNERLLAVGFDNGELQLFDIASTQYIYKTKLNSGVCNNNNNTQYMNSTFEVNQYLIFEIIDLFN